MKPFKPNQYTSLQDGSNGRRVNNLWYKFFERMYQMLGFDEFPIYSELGTYRYAHEMVDPGVTWTNSMAELPDGATRELEGGIKLPNNYKPGTDIYLFADIAPSDTSTNNVVLEFDYAIGDYDSAFVWTGAATTIEAMGGTADMPQRTDLVTISGSTLVKGSFVPFSIARVGGDGDDSYAATMYLIGAGIKYQTEGVGWKVKHP